jgi:selenoprotein W-related protein
VALLLAGWGPVIRRLELVPGTGGVFDVDVNGERVFTKSMLGRYPRPDEVVPLVQERMGPPVLRDG